MTILLELPDKACPILPSVTHYYSQILKPVIGELQITCLKHPHDYDRMRSLLNKVPVDSQLGVMSRFLFYFLQCCRLPFDDDVKQSIRIMNILKLSPLSASAIDSEGMTSLHYFCMRGSCDLNILFRILEINRDLPGIENNFGESPLHQAVGQIRPHPDIIAAFLTACPSAFKKASQSSGKYPLHVILANTRLTSNVGCMRAAELVMAAYPEAAVIEVQEDRLILQVGGPSGGIRCQRRWNPLKRAEEEIPLLFRYMERHYFELGLQRLCLGAGKSQQNMRLLHRYLSPSVNCSPVLQDVIEEIDFY